jgi:hypothetical protein
MFWVTTYACWSPKFSFGITIVFSITLLSSMFTKNPIDCPYIIFRAANLQLDVLDIMKMKIVDSNKEKF